MSRFNITLIKHKNHLPRPEDCQDLLPGGGQGGGAGGAEGAPPSEELQAGASGHRHQPGQGHPEGGGHAAQGHTPTDQETNPCGQIHIYESTRPKEKQQESILTNLDIWGTLTRGIRGRYIYITLK